MKRAALYVLLWGSIVGEVANAQPGKIAKDLQGASGPVNVIVQRWSLLSGGVLAPVGRTLKALPVIGAELDQVDASTLGALAANPDVIYISPDRPLVSSADHY